MPINDNAPLHGGNLQQAVDTYGIPRSDWLDLSTGISPFPWPVPSLPVDVWQRLPEADGQLEHAAHQYYGATALPVPGSQWAIQQLPTLLPRTRVLIQRESYEEYRFWWQAHGHDVQVIDGLPAAADLQCHDVVIVINPNNPTAQLHAPEQLLQLANALHAKQGWLLVDEAFMDVTREHSLLPHLSPEQPVVVLRSLGKFFGLAGIRTGFVLGNAAVQKQLQERLGPWAISHPAQWIATQALQDFDWHAIQRSRLQQSGQQLQTLLAEHFPNEVLASTALFTSVKLTHNAGSDWQHALARQGIWIRRFPQWNRLRLGVTDETGLHRLATALHLAAHSLT